MTTSPIGHGRLLAAALIALTSAAPALPAQSDAGPVFVALLTDGTTVRGRARAVGPDGAFTLAEVDGGERVVPLNALVKLSREGAAPTFRPEGSVLLFPDGDRLYRASVGGATDTAVEVQAFSVPGKLEVPLESLLGIVFTLPAGTEAAEGLLRSVRETPRQSEAIWLANDDRLDVGFLGLTERSIAYLSGNKPENIDRSRVTALGFDPALAAYPRPPGGHIEVTFSDGSRLGIVGPTLAKGHLSGESRFGTPLRFPINEVARIHARTPSVVYLTERAPAAERLVPYVGPTQPVRRDATVEGLPFRLSGEEHDRGLGARSRALQAYRLEPGDRKFQALVGLDDRAGPLGSVVFKVRVDNEEVFSSPPMAAGDPPVPIDVDLSGAKALILLTEFGERGGVRDLADWVEARIIR